MDLKYIRGRSRCNIVNYSMVLLIGQWQIRQQARCWNQKNTPWLVTICCLKKDAHWIKKWLYGVLLHNLKMQKFVLHARNQNLFLQTFHTLSYFIFNKCHQLGHSWQYHNWRFGDSQRIYSTYMCTVHLFIRYTQISSHGMKTISLDTWLICMSGDFH